ncbi:hypothetical protein QR680_012321 [Steinernema hermaphroditum]|uniref:Uncharacterized protein n=1 Tax=Steinernema hermaphroditum TaxID=289476 RepID=A0AA39I3M3_9BILA|nr:hypothetical protein QR680_012321 [Steinernema hermaphroditum]
MERKVLFVAIFVLLAMAALPEVEAGFTCCVFGNKGCSFKCRWKGRCGGYCRGEPRCSRECVCKLCYNDI